MMEKSAVPYDTMSVNSVSTEPMFSRCCCCIPLRIGCFILGYINLILISLRTLYYVGLTVYCGLKTHGFDHIDPHSPIDDELTALTLDHEEVQILGWMLIFMTVCDLVWLAVTIACLVGMHKKRPGPIRTFVAFAIIRLLISMAGYMFQLNSNNVSHPHIITHCLDIGLAAYFILVYYIYAMRLAKEGREVSQVQVNDIAYIYPTKLDKEHLVV